LQTSLEPFSTPDSSPLFAEIPATPGEQDASTAEVVELTAQTGADGLLKWDAPAGDWQVLRFGYTIGDHAYVSTSSEGWGGIRAGCLQRHGLSALLGPGGGTAD
jgi:hypothetical protein